MIFLNRAKNNGLTINLMKIKENIVSKAIQQDFSSLSVSNILRNKAHTCHFIGEFSSRGATEDNLERNR
jgi:hypothetical protein